MDKKELLNLNKTNAVMYKGKVYPIGSLVALGQLTGCAGKKFFYTKKTALEAARRRKKVYGTKPRVYECEYCYCFHHTTKPLRLKEK